MPSSRYLQPIVKRGTLFTSTPTSPMATPSTIANALLTYFLVDTKPTVTNAKSTNAHNSGMPMYMTTLVYHGKNKNVNEIEFLSHSYFGENDNKLHFQHQSFAEILLAEYYLKVFIKYALDKDFNIEEARAKLLLGFPTEQTIRFLIDLLKLLKDSTVSPVTSDTIEKRKLLFPLLATLATEKNNNLFCNNLYYEWFNKHPINSNETTYPRELINNWCFDNSKIDKILLLCKEILKALV